MLRDLYAAGTPHKNPATVLRKIRALKRRYAIFGSAYSALAKIA